MKTAQLILETLQNAKSVAIVSHKSPDGDSIGSSLAFYHLLKKWGINASILHPDPSPSFLNWLPGVNEILNFEEHKALVLEQLLTAEVIVCLDLNESSRVGKDMEVVLNEATGIKIMIDHHLHPSDFCSQIISDPTASSTVELIFRWLEEIGQLDSLDKTIGTCIYLGLMTDTGSFRFSSVSQKTFEIAAHLLSIGLKHHLIHENVYDTNTIDRIRLRGFALSEKLNLIEDIPVAYISLTEEEMNRFNYQKGDTEGLVNQVLSIQGIQMAVLFSEKDGSIKISFRSKGDWKVNQLANDHFDGGGHAFASGGISHESMNKTIAKFEAHIYDYIPN